MVNKTTTNITFEPQQVTWCPAHEHIGPAMENLFIWNLCEKNGFKRMKIHNVQKVGEIF